MELVNRTPNMWKQLSSGLSGYGKAMRVIRNNGMSWMFLIPLVLSLILFYGGITLVNDATEFALNWVRSLLPLESIEEATSGILVTSINVTLWIIFKVLFFLIYAYVGGYVVIIIMSPFLSFVSEKAEFYLTGRKPHNSISFMLYTAGRGGLIAFRNLIYQLLITFVLLIFSFIPLFGFVVPFLLFISSAYFYGFSFMDYHLERKIKGIGTGIAFIKKRRFKAIGIGVPFALLLYIPFLGTFIAGFFTIISTVAATISLIDEEAENPTYSIS